jgi:hypothetical protein
VDAEAIGSCYPQRTEFLYTARNAAEYGEITEMFGDLYPEVSVPKNAGRWIASVQHYMAQAGAARRSARVECLTAGRILPVPSRGQQAAFFPGIGNAGYCLTGGCTAR